MALSKPKDIDGLLQIRYDQLMTSSLKKHLRELKELANDHAPENSPYRNVARTSLNHLKKLKSVLDSRDFQLMRQEELIKVERLKASEVINQLRAQMNLWDDQSQAFATILPHVEREDLDRDGGQSLVQAIIGALDELKARREDDRNEQAADKMSFTQTIEMAGQLMDKSKAQARSRANHPAGKGIFPDLDADATDSRHDEDGDLQATPDSSLINTIKFLVDEYGARGVMNEFFRQNPSLRTARGETITVLAIRLAEKLEADSELIFNQLLRSTDLYERMEMLERIVKRKNEELVMLKSEPF